MLKQNPSFHRICLVAALTITAFTGSYAQTKPERNYQFDEVSTAALELYRKENDTEPKNYDKMLSILDERLGKVKDKNTYDYVMFVQFKSRVFIEKGEYHKATLPMEEGLLISDAATPTYIDEKSAIGISFFLAQLFFQETALTKDKAALLALYAKSELYITRWLKNTPNVTEDGLTFFSSLLYSRAVLDEAHPDKARLNQALDLIDRAMHLTIRPKDNLYLYKMACLQQLEKAAESAEIFELLLKRKPESKDYWKQLAGTYMGLDQAKRAIITMERAQALGLLNTPADNFSLFGLYFNEGQFEHAAELMEKGLKENSIENSQLNWEMLANCYQQLNRDYKAIDTLKRASKLYPKNGQLDLLIAQNFYNLKKLSDALPYLQSSVSKGGGTKPAQTHIFYAYIAYELKKLDLALEQANKAITLPDGVKQGTLFKKAVEDAMAERAEKLKKM